MRISVLDVVIGAWIGTVLGACSPSTLDEKGLKKYILNEDNGLHQKLTKGENRLEVLYRPAELVWADEIRSAASPEERKRILQQVDSMNYFIIRFSNNGGEIESQFVSDDDKFSEVTNYLSFEMVNDLSAIVAGDTIRALDVIHTRTFGSTNGTNVMAVFQTDFRNLHEDFVLVLNDRVLGTGVSSFNFKKKDLLKIPDLNLN